MSRSTGIWLAGAALVLAGCARPPAPAANGAAAQKPPASTDAQPTPSPAVLIVRRTVYRGGDQHGLQPGLNQVEPPADGQVVVGSGEVMVSWQLTPDSPSLPAAAIRSTGQAPDRVNIVGVMVQGHFPPTEVDRREVWLDGVAGSRVVLVRKPEPVVRVGYLDAAGQVVPLTGAETTLPPGPVQLDFRFDLPMDPASLALATAHSWGNHPVSGEASGKAVWLTPDHARWQLPALPANLYLTIDWFRSQDGLFAAPRQLVIHNRETGAWLERVPASVGTAVRVMAVPADVSEALLSPDGKRMALRAWELRTDRNSDWWPTQVQVADLAAGRLSRVELDPFDLTWRPNGELLSFGRGLWGQDEGWSRWDPATGQVSVLQKGRVRVPAISPDGKTAAFLRWPATGASAQDGPFSTSLVLLDLASGGERSSAEFAHDWYHGKEGDFSRWVAWSPDGRQIATLDPVGRGNGSDLVLYDVATGQRRVVAPRLTDVYAWGSRLAWSPDGSRLLSFSAGHPAQVIDLAGGPVVTLPGWGPVAFWDRSGNRILATMGEWDTVYVWDLKTGRRTDLGPGLPVGWDGDSVYVIRWPGSNERHRNEM